MIKARMTNGTIALGLLASVAILVVAARPAPQADQWEYAVFVGSEDGRAAWVSADTILIESDMSLLLLYLGGLDLPDFAPDDERWGARILNHLGADGWELTAVSNGGFRGDNLGPLDEPHRTYYLKRAVGR